MYSLVIFITFLFWFHRERRSFPLPLVSHNWACHLNFFWYAQKTVVPSSRHLSLCNCDGGYEWEKRKEALPQLPSINLISFPIIATFTHFPQPIVEGWYFLYYQEGEVLSYINAFPASLMKSSFGCSFDRHTDSEIHLCFQNFSDISVVAQRSKTNFCNTFVGIVNSYLCFM